MELAMNPRTFRVGRPQIDFQRIIRRNDYSTVTLERNVYLNGRNNEQIIMNATKPARIYKRKLALLIAAHNEELVIEQTVRSAIRAGMKPQDIYVVDDNSSDATSKIVRGILGRTQVIKVRRSGKGLALTKAARKFQLAERYDWIHIADADGGFSPDYFKVFRAQLNPKFAAATGYVRSLPGDSVSQYRVMEYTGTHRAGYPGPHILLPRRRLRPA
jgi:glycosyltransferase involved in cell wall biosynthesis